VVGPGSKSSTKVTWGQPELDDRPPDRRD
jgi:hypothetical protein